MHINSTCSHPDNASITQILVSHFISKLRIASFKTLSLPYRHTRNSNSDSDDGEQQHSERIVSVSNPDNRKKSGPEAGSLKRSSVHSSEEDPDSDRPARKRRRSD